MLRLQHRDIDKVILEEGALGLALDLFFKHEWNSLLHQSVMAICVLVLESKEDHRAELQRHLVVDTQLLQRIMAVFSAEEVRYSRHAVFDRPFAVMLDYLSFVTLLVAGWPTRKAEIPSPWPIRALSCDVRGRHEGYRRVPTITHGWICKQQSSIR